MSELGSPRRRSCRLSCHFGVALLALVGCAVTDAVGQVCISDDTIEFGNREVGSHTTAAVTVSNCSDAPWSFTNVSVDPATGSAYQVNTTCTTGLTLAPAASCMVSVLFAPTTTGQTSGGLWLYNTTSTPAPLITFYGRGINGENGTASLTFVPASANFGTQPVGTTASPLNVALHNQGPAPLTLSAIVLNGPEVYDFFGFDGTCAIGGTIAAGSSCSMVIDFRPEAPGLRLANLVIDAPQLASLAIMPISGMGQPALAGLASYEGLWWGAPAGSESGWGINIAQQGASLFADLVYL